VTLHPNIDMIKQLDDKILVSKREIETRIFALPHKNKKISYQLTLSDVI